MPTGRGCTARSDWWRWALGFGRSVGYTGTGSPSSSSVARMVMGLKYGLFIDDWKFASEHEAHNICILVPTTPCPVKAVLALFFCLQTRRISTRAIALQPMRIWGGQHPGRLIFFERQRRVICPMRIGQVGSANHDQIHLLICNHAVCGGGLVDTP